MDEPGCDPWRRANFLEGEWRAAASGARRAGPLGTGDDWPQSDGEDVACARATAQTASRAWARLNRDRRLELLRALARALERDEPLGARLAARFGLAREELAPHARGLEHEVLALGARAVPAAPGVAWVAPDWSELVRLPLVDLARELLAGRAVVLVADARLPELGERVAQAAAEAGFPPGVVGLLHGARRELLGRALLQPSDGLPAFLVASGLVEEVADLRRIDPGVEMRLRALRCGTYELADERPLDAHAEEVVERAFGRGTTLSGQLPGSVARVFCPARRFASFTERLLAALETRSALAPVPLVDDAAAQRVRAAWELGHDEGATCIAGGDGDLATRALPPTVFTNVEAHMALARRQDPLPVLCLLRGG